MENIFFKAFLKFWIRKRAFRLKWRCLTLLHFDYQDLFSSTQQAMMCAMNRLLCSSVIFSFFFFFLAAASIQLTLWLCCRLPPASVQCHSDVAFTNTCIMVHSFHAQMCFTSLGVHEIKALFGTWHLSWFADSHHNSRTILSPTTKVRYCNLVGTSLNWNRIISWVFVSPRKCNPWWLLMAAA